MKRDIVCAIRVIADSLPPLVRNSKELFWLASLIFDAPSSLFDFRKNFKSGLVDSLKPYYTPASDGGLGTFKLSSDTDVNSFHKRYLLKSLSKADPQSVLDVGCGSGCILRLIANKLKIDDSRLYGIDYAPADLYTSRFNILQASIEEHLSLLPDNYVDSVICTHVLEHIPNSAEVLAQLRRIAKKQLIIICPLEKEFEWGLNYHVHFFACKNEFSKFLQADQNKNISFISWLGDIMSVEYF